MSILIATGTPERPLIFVKDNDGHGYYIHEDEQERFRRWVQYMESEDSEAKWEGHEYESLGSHPSCYKIIGEVRE